MNQHYTRATAGQGNTKAVQLVKPTQELVKTAVVNCAKAGTGALVGPDDSG